MVGDTGRHRYFVFREVYLRNGLELNADLWCVRMLCVSSFQRWATCPDPCSFAIAVLYDVRASAIICVSAVQLTGDGPKINDGWGHRSSAYNVSYLSDWRELDADLWCVGMLCVSSFQRWAPCPDQCSSAIAVLYDVRASAIINFVYPPCT